MEIVNLLVIITMITICLVWALKKRKEIETTTINYNAGENQFQEGAEGERDILQDQQDLNFTSNLFQGAVEAMLKKINFICLIYFIVLAVIVWVSIVHSFPLFNRFLTHV